MRYLMLAAGLLFLLPIALAPDVRAQLLPESGPEESRVALRDVPYYIVRAARRIAGRRRISAVYVEEEGDDRIYEFHVETASGRSMEIDIRDDGTLEEVEREIRMRDVPKVVLARLKAEMPEFNPTYVERSERPGHGVWYEFQGLTADASMSLGVEISSNGKKFLVARDAIGE